MTNYIDWVPEIDPVFLALPLGAAAAAGLGAASDAGAQHADVRIGRSHEQNLSVRDRNLEDQGEQSTTGMAVRVLVDGVWGFAAGDEVSVDAAARLGRQAVELARQAAPLAITRVELAAEPVHVGDWVSDFEVDPFAIPAHEKAELLLHWTGSLLDRGIQHATASVRAVRELSHYEDSSGTRTTQMRVRLGPEIDATVVEDSGAFDSMGSLAPPVGRGWEYLLRGWDFEEELAQLPDLLQEKMRAPSVEAGTYDVVIDPTNLWLTIHESVGHATELDRALGYEANYAGTSFATPDKLGTLQYGSALMNIVGDRNVRFGLATVGFDDEGVAAQKWDIVKNGTLVGYQLDRAMAHQFGVRSNGCAYADSPTHFPIQRMANVSLLPDPVGPSLDDLISGVEDGIYIVGDRSWSIDMQRYNFQFTGQRFHRIRAGRLVGQVRDVAYQSNTLDFWNRLQVLGGPQTYQLGGALNCGKGQPGQVAAVSHGCPAARFAGINILNSRSESGS